MPPLPGSPPGLQGWVSLLSLLSTHSPSLPTQGVTKDDAPLDCEPEAGRARPLLCLQRRVRQQSRASGTTCGTQDCTCWCHPAQYAGSWACPVADCPPLCPTVPELQDHLPTLCWPLLLHLRGRQRQQPGLPGGHPQLCGGARAGGQGAAGAVRMPLLGCGPSACRRGHCLSLPTLMFPPVSVSLQFLSALFLYLLIYFACTGS